MKYLATLFAGIVLGVALFFAGMIYNPFIADRGISPLSVTDAQVMSLAYSRVSSDSIVFTNDGESRQKPHPEKIQQLWEAPVRFTSAMATVVQDARGQAAGIGIKFSSQSERTSLINGKALIDSAWYVYMPGRGSLFIEQSENYWPFLTEVVFPAWKSSANNWKGSWIRDMTAGPGALGTARVTGGNGELQGLATNGVESMSVRAYSADTGHVSAEGRLLIEIPSIVADDQARSD